MNATNTTLALVKSHMDEINRLASAQLQAAQEHKPLEVLRLGNEIKQLLSSVDLLLAAL